MGEALNETFLEYSAQEENLFLGCVACAADGSVLVGEQHNPSASRGCFVWKELGEDAVDYFY